MSASYTAVYGWLLVRLIPWKMQYRDSLTAPMSGHTASIDFHVRWISQEQLTCFLAESKIVWKGRTNQANSTCWSKKALTDSFPDCSIHSRRQAWPLTEHNEYSCTYSSIPNGIFPQVRSQLLSCRSNIAYLAATMPLYNAPEKNSDAHYLLRFERSYTLPKGRVRPSTGNIEHHFQVIKSIKNGGGLNEGINVVEHRQTGKWYIQKKLPTDIQESEREILFPERSQATKYCRMYWCLHTSRAVSQKCKSLHTILRTRHSPGPHQEIRGSERAISPRTSLYPRTLHLARSRINDKRFSIHPPRYISRRYRGHGSGSVAANRPPRRQTRQHLPPQLRALRISRNCPRRLCKSPVSQAIN